MEKWRQTTMHVSEEDKEFLHGVKVDLKLGSVGDALHAVLFNPELFAHVATVDMPKVVEASSGSLEGKAIETAEAEPAENSSLTLCHLYYLCQISLRSPAAVGPH